jgi:hypothetical protein
LVQNQYRLFQLLLDLMHLSVEMLSRSNGCSQTPGFGLTLQLIDTD